jgi:ketosteroid isomerase-like protein
MRWLLALAAILAFTACHRVPDERRIRDAMAAMQQAVQERNPRDFMRHVSADFTGNDGRLDHDALHNLLRAEVLRNESIGATLGPIDVELQGDRATVHVTATLTGGSGGWLPDRGAVYAITSGWRREGGQWRCYNATWTQRL